MLNAKQSIWLKAVLVCGILPGSLLLLDSCTGKPDPNKPFEMALNGKPYRTSHGNPLGAVEELEAGYSMVRQYRIVFPLKHPSNLPRPGLELTFDPAAMTIGTDIVFGGPSGRSDIQIAYHPAAGDKPSQGLLLVFEPRERGWGKIRFDRIEPKIGGRVIGMLMEAVLYGYTSGHEKGLVEPPGPMELHLWNFAFDVVIQGSLFQ
ncbi:MAG TPA: hypothetical protein VGB38_02515 [bacterium]